MQTHSQKSGSDLDIDNFSDFLLEISEAEFGNGEDLNKENTPEAIVEKEDSSLKEYNRASLKEIQLAVQQREAIWKKRGTSFTFDRVDEWLKQSEFQNRKESINAATGNHMVEQTQHKKMHVKRKYRNGHRDNYEMESNSITESDMELSDATSNTSVDTAKYIRANQNHRSSKVTKTIIKKYIVTSKHINHHRKIHHSSKAHRKKSIPLQAITNDITKISPSPKKKFHRKTRHELNKRRRSQRDPSSSSSSSCCNSDACLDQRKPRKIPVSKLQQTKSMPIDLQSLSNESKKVDYAHSLWMGDNETKKIATFQPKVILDKLQNTPSCSSANTSHTRKSLNASQTGVSSNQTENTNTSHGKPNETVLKSMRDSFCEPSRCSSVLNMSCKSWSHLPKKVVIYQPDSNATPDRKIKLTKEHLEKAIGAEAADDVLKGHTCERIFDSNLKVVFELPNDDTISIESDQDPMDLDLQSLQPILTAVRNTPGS